MGKDASAAHVGKYTEALANLDDEAFFRWFSSSKSLEEEAISGFWDFSIHILTPVVCNWASQPHTKTALEIGYGGGRLLNAAQRFFGYAVGIDIHDRGPTVKRRVNAGLIRCDGETIPVASGSIDFVYSFIVLMHLQSFDAFLDYLKETFKVLKSGGVAQLYYGLKSTDGYSCNEVPANHMSLIIGAETVHGEAKKIGFELLDSGRSYKRAPDGYPDVIGQQGYVTLMKP